MGGSSTVPVASTVLVGGGCCLMDYAAWWNLYVSANNGCRSSKLKETGVLGRFCGVMIGFEKSSINFSIMNVERGSLGEEAFEN